MTTRSWLVFARMMMGLVAMLVVYEGDTVCVAVETFLEGYEKDAGKADRAFKYRICEVSGVVADFDVNWLNEPAVKLKGERTGGKTVSFIFLTSQADWVGQFRKGDAMTVRGICQGKDRRFGYHREQDEERCPPERFHDSAFKNHMNMWQSNSGGQLDA